MTASIDKINVIKSFEAHDELFQYIGMLAVLACQAENYRVMSLYKIMRSALPPLRLQQFRIYLDQQRRPLAGLTYAFLSDEAEARYLANEPLRETDFCSGDIPYIIDAIARPPWGRYMIRDMYMDPFTDRGVIFAKRELYPGKMKKIAYRHGRLPSLRNLDADR